MSNVKESFIEGLQDQILEVVYSSMPIEPNARNELQFFSKNDKEFTNMKASNAFPKLEVFWLRGINLDIYNADGAPLNWASRDIKGLRKFFNEGTLEIHIGSKVYLNRLPLRNLIRLPEVSWKDANDEPRIHGQVESPRLILPQAIKLDGGMDFHVSVIGHAGAPTEMSDVRAGWSKETRLQVNLYGMLGRPVQ